MFLAVNKLFHFGQDITRKYPNTESFSLASYAPIIDSMPTDMATIYNTMEKCVELCCKAGQQYLVQTFDQQLYAIAQQIKWSRPLEFQNHIIRLGEFHTLSCFITSIG
jgi:hypothetical protein